MRAAVTSLCLTLAAAIPAAAQISPFDMSPERSTPSAAPAPQEPTSPPTAVPDPLPPAVIRPALPFEPTVPSIAAEPPVRSSPVETFAEPVRRYLLPFSELVLPGEYARRSWSVYLTPEQAAAKATLNLGYQNAIVVAPEISHLRLTINGTQLVDTPIASPDNPSGLAAEVPPGLVHAGMNDITVEAIQRHRTDCTTESTYELWTQIEPEKTYLSFEGSDVARWKRVDDIRAVGVNDSGATKFNFVVPAAEQVTATPVVVRLAQSLALMANMPNQSFTVSETALPPAGAGEANVIAGAASELAGILSALPPGSDTTPTVAVMDDPKLGPSLVVTGPTWQAVEAAVDDLGKQVDRPVGMQRSSLQTRLWRTPDVPMLFGATQLRFADLGVNTLEFSGRRVRTEFAVGVPADFYATAYGEATILLDAAY